MKRKMRMKTKKMMVKTKKMNIPTKLKTKTKIEMKRKMYI
jgi:hypothetical protein